LNKLNFDRKMKTALTARCRACVSGQQVPCRRQRVLRTALGSAATIAAMSLRFGAANAIKKA
jgi:hypothetical protein